jgi:excisionase family DNA binding protein
MPTAHDLAAPVGPSLTTREYAAIVGISTQTVRREIECGELRAHRTRRRGRRHQYRIAWADARRHAKQLGVLLDASPPR